MTTTYTSNGTVFGNIDRKAEGGMYTAIVNGEVVTYRERISEVLAYQATIIRECFPRSRKTAERYIDQLNTEGHTEFYITQDDLVVTLDVGYSAY